MTEQTVPFGGTAVADPPQPLLPGDDDTSADGGNRRKLIAVGAGAGVLVLLIAAFFLLKGGGSSTPQGLVPSHHVVPPATSRGSHPATKPVKLPKPFKGTVGRDPFNPLYSAPTTGSGAGSTATSGSTSTSTSTTSTTTTTGSTGTTGTTATYHPVWIQLNSVDGNTSATFTIGYSNGSSFKALRFKGVQAPQPGSRTIFASTFALLRLHNGIATVQFGDGTPFLLDTSSHNAMVVG